MACVRAAARVKRYTSRVFDEFLDSEYLWRNREVLSDYVQLVLAFHAVLYTAICSLRFNIPLDMLVILRVIGMNFASGLVGHFKVDCSNCDSFCCVTFGCSIHACMHAW